MHEYSIVQAMFDQIELTARANGAESVRRVHVRIGATAGVELSLLRSAYEIFRAGTMCADAPLDVDEVPVSWTCPDGHGDIAPGAHLTCAVCGRAARLASGDEIILDRLELEVP